ncbi:tetratricopeptide repeat protein [Kribbella antiqua]|uniref:Tetratricopeptide repeat protein n=1 Tax=Kribbella antiqua TaxID=2512217 RepID=A0A4V2S3T4_9ACTN|nr:helix-turn-helix domain-containing protein [Kribbella antiqua]TCO45660.1 tetratricopeptide repeat protein [Kribbella antiqua]
MASLSELLRRHRSAAGLTQAALAEKAGLSEQAISVLERGIRSRPRIDTIRALTAALGLDTKDAEEFTAVARGKGRKPRAPEPEAPAPVDTLPTPWQLPPAIRDFTGRTAQIDAILSALRAPDGLPNGAVGLVAVTGMGGIGKTALAVQAAHKLVDSYPDGHLYLNLRGYGPGNPMTTGDALRQLLRSLGLDLQLIPEGVEEAAGLLRSQLAGRRVLMLLDNATDVRTVMPLLPGSPGSAAIITSRGSMATLHGARQILLDALSETESVELLSGVIGQARVAAEPDAAETLALFTGRLPLAVRLIGARLAARPNWPIQHLVDLLQDEERRLDTLGSDETGVRASIASSIRFLETSDRDLDREAARALPLLSVPDGSDLLTIVAAHLLDIGVRQADAILERLVDLNLLESIAPDRYRFHDLIRAYARELAEDSLTTAERDAGLERILRFYTGFAWACQFLTHPASPRLALATTLIEPVPALADAMSALQWLDVEQRNVMERYHQAAASSLAGSALFPELTLALFGYHESRSRWVEMRELCLGAVDLALKLDLPMAAAWLEHDSAIPEVENGTLEAATTHLFRALAMFRELSDGQGQARCCTSLTHVLGRLDRIDEALELGAEALVLSQQLGDRTIEGVSHIALGGLYDRKGDYELADQAFQRGIALARESGDLRSLVKRYLNAGFSNLLVGRLQDALEPLFLSLETARRAGNEDLQSQALQCLAAVYASQAEYDEARRYIERAMILVRHLGNRVREGCLILELGKVRAAAGDSAAAIEHLTAAVAVLHDISPHFEAAAKDLLALVRRGDSYSYTFDDSQVR